MMTITGAFVLFDFLALDVSAFCAPNSRRASQTNRHVPITMRFSSPSADVESNEKGASMNLGFNAVYSSDPVPAASPQAIFEFFQDPAQRNCMVSAGNERQIEEVQDSGTLLDLWKSRSRELGATEPDESDVVLRAVTGAMRFPGLTLTSEAYVGAKLLEHSADEYPVYEFSLLFDKQRVEGFKIAVWIFNKLTGADDEASENKAVTRSLSKATAITTENGEIVFQVTITFTIQVFFPKILLRILPVSKEKAEQQGSAAIRKVLEKDLNKAMRVLRQQYLEHLS